MERTEPDTGGLAALQHDLGRFSEAGGEGIAPRLESELAACRA